MVQLFLFVFYNLYSYKGQIYQIKSQQDLIVYSTLNTLVYKASCCAYVYSAFNIVSMHFKKVERFFPHIAILVFFSIRTDNKRRDLDHDNNFPLSNFQLFLFNSKQSKQRQLLKLFVHRSRNIASHHLKRVLLTDVCPSREQKIVT